MSNQRDAITKQEKNSYIMDTFIKFSVIFLDLKYIVFDHANFRIPLVATTVHRNLLPNILWYDTKVMYGLHAPTKININFWHA